MGMGTLFIDARRHLSKHTTIGVRDSTAAGELRPANNTSPVISSANYKLPTTTATSVTIGSADIDSNGHTEAKFNERYLLGRVLGSGSFSTVRLAVDRFTGKEWACKIVTEQAERELLLREVEILKHLDHPNLLKYREHFSTPENLYIITELLKGTDLRAAVLERGSYAEDDAREIIRQILDALSYLDSKGVAHRDLKMENIMLTPTASDMQIKIIDFGLAGQLSDNTAAFREAYGTPIYFAPEVASGVPYGTSCDVWAAGVILFVLLSGDFPFYGNSMNQLVESICHASLRFVDPVWELTSSGAKHLVQTLLTGNPAKRVAAKEAALHPWLTQ